MIFLILGTQMPHTPVNQTSHIITDDQEIRLLPSPTLSPTQALMTPDGISLGISTRLLTLPGMLSHMTANSPLQTTSAESIQADFENISRIYPQFSIPQDGDLSAIPAIISSFDGLPQQLKSYLLLQLLRRCPLPTLQFISCLILPTLRRDFLGILPIELSTSILGYV
jgi:F-box and WD-40 domain protein CDC4